MALTSCRLCGKVFSSEFEQDICPECAKYIETIYSEAHDYIKQQKQGFSAEQIADVTDVNINEIKRLMNLGYFERDMQTYGPRPTQRQKLVMEILEEIEKGNLKTKGGMGRK